MIEFPFQAGVVNSMINWGWTIIIFEILMFCKATFLKNCTDHKIRNGFKCFLECMPEFDSANLKFSSLTVSPLFQIENLSKVWTRWVANLKVRLKLILIFFLLLGKKANTIPNNIDLQNTTAINYLKRVKVQKKWKWKIR